MVYVEECKFLGEPAIKAGNEYLEMMIVPGWGSNLISIVDKQSGTELLRTPVSVEEYQEHPVLFGTPVLFPPNRIEDGRFTFLDRTYQFEINEADRHNHIHGFLYRERWKLLKAEVMGKQVRVETEFDSNDYPHVLRQFPHHFVIRMTYVVEEASVRKNATIYNRGDEPFPWGFGYHTTFAFPPGAGTFSVTADERWKLTDRLLPTGELEETQKRTELNQGTDLRGWMLDDVFLSSVMKDGRNEATITLKDKGIHVKYQVDDYFKHWVVYNADGNQGFVCPEPYTWVTNAPNLDLPASLTGLQVLASGTQITLKSKITVSRL